MTNAIKCNGTKKITIDMGHLNCINEPNIINLDGCEFILRYNTRIDGNAYGVIVLERLAK